MGAKSKKPKKTPETTATPNPPDGAVTEGTSTPNPPPETIVTTPPSPPVGDTEGTPSSVVALEKPEEPKTGDPVVVSTNPVPDPLIPPIEDDSIDFTEKWGGKDSATGEYTIPNEHVNAKKTDAAIPDWNAVWTIAAELAKDLLGYTVDITEKPWADMIEIRKGQENSRVKLACYMVLTEVWKKFLVKNTREIDKFMSGNNPANVFMLMAKKEDMNEDTTEYAQAFYDLIVSDTKAQLVWSNEPEIIATIREFEWSTPAKISKSIAEQKKNLDKFWDYGKANTPTLPVVELLLTSEAPKTPDPRRFLEGAANSTMLSIFCALNSIMIDLNKAKITAIGFPSIEQPKPFSKMLTNIWNAVGDDTAKSQFIDYIKKEYNIKNSTLSPSVEFSVYFQATLLRPLRGVEIQPPGAVMDVAKRWEIARGLVYAGVFVATEEQFHLATRGTINGITVLDSKGTAESVSGLYATVLVYEWARVLMKHEYEDIVTDTDVEDGIVNHDEVKESWKKLESDDRTLILKSVYNIKKVMNDAKYDKFAFKKRSHMFYYDIGLFLTDYLELDAEFRTSKDGKTVLDFQMIRLLYLAQGSAQSTYEHSDQKIRSMLIGSLEMKLNDVLKKQYYRVIEELFKPRRHFSQFGINVPENDAFSSYVKENKDIEKLPDLVNKFTCSISRYRVPTEFIDEIEWKMIDAMYMKSPSVMSWELADDFGKLYVFTAYLHRLLKSREKSNVSHETVELRSYASVSSILTEAINGGIWDSDGKLTKGMVEIAGDRFTSQYDDDAKHKIIKALIDMFGLPSWLGEVATTDDKAKNRDALAIVDEILQHYIVTGHCPVWTLVFKQGDTLDQVKEKLKSLTLDDSLEMLILKAVSKKEPAKIAKPLGKDDVIDESIDEKETKKPKEKVSSNPFGKPQKTVENPQKTVEKPQKTEKQITEALENSIIVKPTSKGKLSVVDTNLSTTVATSVLTEKLAEAEKEFNSQIDAVGKKDAIAKKTAGYDPSKQEEKKKEEMVKSQAEFKAKRKEIIKLVAKIEVNEREATKPEPVPPKLTKLLKKTNPSAPTEMIFPKVVVDSLKVIVEDKTQEAKFEKIIETRKATVKKSEDFTRYQQVLDSKMSKFKFEPTEITRKSKVNALLKQLKDLKGREKEEANEIISTFVSLETIPVFEKEKRTETVELVKIEERGDALAKSVTNVSEYPNEIKFVPVGETVEVDIKTLLPAGVYFSTGSVYNKDSIISLDYEDKIPNFFSKVPESTPIKTITYTTPQTRHVFYFVMNNSGDAIVNVFRLRVADDEPLVFERVEFTRGGAGTHNTLKTALFRENGRKKAAYDSMGVPNDVKYFIESRVEQYSLITVMVDGACENGYVVDHNNVKYRDGRKKLASLLILKATPVEYAERMWVRTNLPVVQVQPVVQVNPTKVATTIAKTKPVVVTESELQDTVEKFTVTVVYQFKTGRYGTFEKKTTEDDDETDLEALFKNDLEKDEDMKDVLVEENTSFDKLRWYDVSGVVEVDEILESVKKFKVLRDVLASDKDLSEEETQTFETLEDEIEVKVKKIVKDMPTLYQIPTDKDLKLVTLLPEVGELTLSGDPVVNEVNPDTEVTGEIENKEEEDEVPE